MLHTAANHVIAPAAFKNLTYDPIKDFAPIGATATSPFVVVVSPTLPVHTVAELIAYSKANPGKLNWGFGLGTSPHLIGELFKHLTKADIASIPYKGGANAVTDILAGQIHMNIGTTATIVPLVKAGKLRAIAVIGEGRYADLPDVPTMAESGVPLRFEFWTGLLAPAATPPDIVQKLNTHLERGACKPGDEGEHGQARPAPQDRDAAAISRVPRSRAPRLDRSGRPHRREDRLGPSGTGNVQERPAMTLVRSVLAVGFAIGLTAGAANAQTYPDRLVRTIVPQGPGGPTDLLARVAAQRLQAVLHQNFIIENRGGAGGVIAAKAAGSAEPDGYTLFMGNTSVLVLIPILSRSAGYDPAKLFTPVARLAESYQVLVVHPSLPVKTVADLVAYAKANPGKLNYASAGSATRSISPANCSIPAGTNIVHVPYNSGAEATTAVLGGQVQMTFVNITGLPPLIADGKLRALAVTSPKRLALLPDFRP